jgi:hypothetical protein
VISNSIEDQARHGSRHCDFASLSVSELLRGLTPLLATIVLFCAVLEAAPRVVACARPTT